MERSSVIITLLKIGLSNIRLPQTSLAFHQNRTVEVKKPALKQENGFGFRLESGKSLLLEKDGTKAFERPTAQMGLSLKAIRTHSLNQVQQSNKKTTTSIWKIKT